MHWIKESLERVSYTVNKFVLLWILWSFSKMTQQSWSLLNIKRCGKREQNGRGVGGHGVHLSPWIHQEDNFRHRSACRTPAESGQVYLTSGKEYIEP